MVSSTQSDIVTVSLMLMVTIALATLIRQRSEVAP
jgi:flagellin-like protein